MKNNNPLVSIIITAYNEEGNIEAALRSVLGQQIKDDMEIIIVDDASSDRTVDICKPLVEADQRVNIVQLQKNSGHVTASMTGIASSRGKYFIRVDGDDIVYPELAASLLQTADREKTEVVIGGYVKLYCNTHKKESILHPESICDFIMCGNLISRELFSRAGGLKHLRFEEYDLFLRLLEQCEFAWNEQALYEYRIHNASYCHQDNYWQEGIREMLELWPSKKLEDNGFSDLLKKYRNAR